MHQVYIITTGHLLYAQVLGLRQRVLRTPLAWISATTTWKRNRSSLSLSMRRKGQ